MFRDEIHCRGGGPIFDLVSKLTPGAKLIVDVRAKSIVGVRAKCIIGVRAKSMVGVRAKSIVGVRAQSIVSVLLVPEVNPCPHVFVHREGAGEGEGERKRYIERGIDSEKGRYIYVYIERDR